MSVFAKLFGKKSLSSPSGVFGDVDLEPPPSPFFDQAIVRLVVFQERCAGRVPLYDSKAIERIEDALPTPGKSTQESRIRWRCRTLDNAPTSLPPPSPGRFPSDSASRSKSLPVGQTPPGGQTIPMIASSGGVKYRLSKPPSDIKMLAEMAFGSLPMKSLGVDFKIHEIKNPHQIMMSQVFTFAATKESTSTHGSRGESFPNQASTAAVSQLSTPIAHSLHNPGNSRFYLHLSALDAAVDAPLPSSGISRSSSSRRSLYQDFSAETALATSISSATRSSNSSVLGASASHGHLGVAPTPQVIADGSPKKSASSAALLTGVEVEANDSSSTLVSKDATLCDEMARSMPRSKPVDVPVFHLNGPEDEDQNVPSSSLSSSTGSSSCLSSPSHHSFQSNAAFHNRQGRLAASGWGDSTEWGGFSPSGSISGASSVSSALSGSYVSVHKRWMRNQAKSLELTGRSGQARNALSSDGGVEGRGQKMREDGKNSRRNLESLFHSSSTRKEPTTKLAFAMVFDLEALSCSSMTSSTVDSHQKAALILKTFLFTHASLIESHIRVLRQTIRSAVVGNKKDFLHLITSAFEDQRKRLADLISSPRLPHPLWLRLTSSSSSAAFLVNESSASGYVSKSLSSTSSGSSEVSNYHQLRKRTLCHAFLRKFCQIVDRFDTKHSNYFFSSLLTAMLTRHLAWVTTVSPSVEVTSLSTSFPARRQYLEKRLAPWLDLWADCNAYNPLWAQLGDLFGAVAFPLKVSQTVIVGTKKDVIKDLLFILSYFIRCSDVVSSSSASFAPDFWDQAINQLLLQESIISTRSGDTIVDVVPNINGAKNSDVNAAKTDFDDKTVELNDPYFGISDDDDDDQADMPPMFRPRSNTVLERRVAVRKAKEDDAKGSTVADVNVSNHPSTTRKEESSESLLSSSHAPVSVVDDGEKRSVLSNIFAASDSVGMLRKDSGILVESDRRRDGEPNLEDSGCFDSLNGGMICDNAVKVVCDRSSGGFACQISGRAVGDHSVQQNDLTSIETIDSKLAQESTTTALPSHLPSQIQHRRQTISHSENLCHDQRESPKKISPSSSSTLGLPPEAHHRSKTHSIDSQYSSKTSSTCQSDEGFDSIPSEATSKDGSPPLSESHCAMNDTADGVSLSATPRGRVDIMDPSTFNGLNEPDRCAGRRSHFAGSKISTNANSASLCDLDATEIPRLRVDEDSDSLQLGNSGDAGCLDTVDTIASNLGYSLIGNVYDSFRPDFALQGTTNREFVNTQLPQHLHRQLEHSFLDDQVTASCCIVADVDRCVVEVYSTEHSDPTTPVHVTPANMVVGVTESLRDLYKVSSSSSTSSLSSSPELCLAHLEDKLQEIYFKSLTFSKLLPTLQQWHGVDRNELRSLVGFEMSDVPLLTAVASTHEENVQI